MSPSKPTILFVHGGWGTPITYLEVMAELHKLGYPTAAVLLPSVNIVNPKGITAQEDAEAIREKGIFPLLEGGSDVLVVGHSIGGGSADMACHGLGKRERLAKGEKTGVVGLVFVATIFTKMGHSYFELFGGKFSPGVEFNEEEGWYFDLEPERRQFHDVPKPLQNLAVAYQRRQSFACFDSKHGPLAHLDPEFKGMIGFLRTSEDYCIPTAFQDLHIAQFEEEYGKDSLIVKKIDGGHTPFLSRPAETAKLVADFAVDFEKVQY